MAVNNRKLENGWVPAEPIMRRVKAYIEREDKKIGYPYSAKKVGGANDNRIPMHGTMSMLAVELKFHYDHLRRLMKGTYATMHFDDADRTLCKIDEPWAWHFDPELNAIYQEINLARIDTLRPCQKPIAEVA